MHSINSMSKYELKVRIDEANMCRNSILTRAEFSYTDGRGIAKNLLVEVADAIQLRIQLYESKLIEKGGKL